MRKLILQLLAFSGLILVIFLFFNHEAYFTSTLQMIMHNKLKYSLLSFLLIVSDIMLPIPSSVVLYTNGLVFGVMSGFLLSMISVIAASIFGYLLGRLLSGKANTLISPQAVDFYNRYGFLAIFLTRGIPILAESVVLICGYNKILFRTYIWLTILGYIPVCLVYAYFGAFGKDANHFLLSFSFSILLSVLFWLFGIYLSKKGKKIKLV